VSELASRASTSESIEYFFYDWASLEERGPQRGMHETAEQTINFGRNASTYFLAKSIAKALEETKKKINLK
jgi:hypothetical protein